MLVCRFPHIIKGSVLASSHTIYRRQTAWVPGDEAGRVWAAGLLAAQLVCALCLEMHSLSQRHLQEMGSYESTVALHRQGSILSLSSLQSAASVSSSKVCVGVHVCVCACVDVCACV